MTSHKAALAEIEARSAAIEREIGEHVADRGRLALVQAPPGSGKTWLLLKTVTQAYAIGRRVAIATVGSFGSIEQAGVSTPDRLALPAVSRNFPAATITVPAPVKPAVGVNFAV